MSIDTSLSLEQFEKLRTEGQFVLDLRSPEHFCDGFIPDSLPFSGSPEEKDFLEGLPAQVEGYLLILDDKPSAEYFDELQRYGLKQVTGYLKGGFEAWQGKPQLIISIEPEEIVLDMKYGQPRIIDVRNEAQYKSSHLAGAEHITAESMAYNTEELPDKDTVYLYDENGNLSLMLIAWLKRFNLHNYYHLQGGIKVLKAAGAETE